MVFVLNKTNTIANNFLLQIRDKHIQVDRMRFRFNLERLGEILAYEISKKLEYKQETTETVLGHAEVSILANQPVLIPVLRAAMPFYNGFLNFFEEADSGFIGAYRRESEGSDITVNMDYKALGNINNRDVILIDPMLATGTSLVKSVNSLLTNGKPRHFHLASVIAAPEGVDYVAKQLDVAYSLWTCAVDEKLNSKSYIIPGLGDAGDLAFGMKL